MRRRRHDVIGPCRGSVFPALWPMWERRLLTLDAEKADPFGYIERFHDPRVRRRIAIQDQRLSAVFQPSVKTG